MQIYRLDPLSDPRWQRFVQKHPGAGVFHSRPWLEALHDTYGYEPVAYAVIGPDQELVSGIPFCKIRSFVTGRRLVSLPFSDHCQPLVENAEELMALLAAAQDDVRREGFKYLELRPLHLAEQELVLARLSKSSEAVVRCCDLARSRPEIVGGFHKSCILRRIRGGHANLVCEEGRSEFLLGKFYRLLVFTRRRLQLPPQPLAWFRNLVDRLGDALTIRVLSTEGVPIASTLTLTFKRVVTYKYSCSNPQFNSLGGTIHLIWGIIQDAMQAGATELDWGKSDLDTPGLIVFKDHWGAAKSPLTFYRYPASVMTCAQNPAVVAASKRLLRAFPDPVFTAVGGFLYRHVG